MIEYINEQNALNKIKMLYMNPIYLRTVYGNFNWHYLLLLQCSRAMDLILLS
jgi:hypothetical protein